MSARRSSGRPTLRQVAALSGVSLKTASRVLNGEPYVSEATARKVLDAAAQLGFRRNVIARELRAGARSSSVGLIIGDVANPFYARIARGAERTLRAAGLQLITASSDEDPGLEHGLVADMLERRLSALLLVTSSTDHSYLEAERKHGVPVVFLDRPPEDIVADTIVLDNAGGVRQAVEHFLQNKHRRIGLVGDLSRLSTHRERVAAFEQAMEHAGIPNWQRFVRADSHDVDAAERSVRELLSQRPAPTAGIPNWQRFVRADSHDVDAAERSVRELLSQRPAPTALLTTNNRITIGALRALREDDAMGSVALIGFDDFDLADLLGITVVAHDPDAMGALGAEQVLHRLTGETGPARRIVLPTRLVPRGSGERRPARRPGTGA